MDFKPTQVNDKRCTRVGRWLRRSRLDEPPQLYNILWGDMHFLGPSAFRIEEEGGLAEKIPHYQLRWTITAGATRMGPNPTALLRIGRRQHQ